MNIRNLVSIFALGLSCFSPLQNAGAQKPSVKDRNVIIVMTDGLRWQEVFRGADETLLTPINYYDGRDVKKLQQKFLAPTPEDRRARLLPFLWSTFIPQGQFYGDLDAGSDAHVTNGFNFSYPGYSETLTGHPDPNINSNDNKPNPNVTVLEWLNKQPGLQGKVAAFGAWEVIGGIVNAARCNFPVAVSYDPLLLTPSTPEIDLLNQWKAESPRIWDDEAFDAPTFYTAMAYLKLKQPRVMFLSLGETDDWAHGGNYGEYLDSANRVDADLAQLWKQIQSMPQYRNNTTLIFLTDHGRGSGPDDWKGHGQKTPDSKNIFIGLFGAGVPATGLQKNVAEVTQNQVAATVAQYLGLDWNAQEPRAGKPLPTQATH
ncbi:alkaline phosphatase family protein [Granulicella arctica]|uniref:alkaline phosphatase family protein n=1 Tax=Granulicella arctica TaxID=940613 RepID=UPI0021E01601|nr:alkaline phosphatase family protein [Granulicella arctica]